MGARACALLPLALDSAASGSGGTSMMLGCELERFLWRACGRTCAVTRLGSSARGLLLVLVLLLLVLVLELALVPAAKLCLLVLAAALWGDVGRGGKKRELVDAALPGVLLGRDLRLKLLVFASA